MGKIVTTTTKQKKSQPISGKAKSSADRTHNQSTSRKQGVPVHLNKSSEEVTTGHTAGCDEKTQEHADVARKINEGTLNQGQALDVGTQQVMTDQLGLDFSAVKVHTDNEAASLAESVNANAFTYGKDIVFNQGQYQPHTPAGKELLIHELEHVVQQRDAKRLQRQAKPGATTTTKTKKDE